MKRQADVLTRTGFGGRPNCLYFSYLTGGIGGRPRVVVFVRTRLLVGDVSAGTHPMDIEMSIVGISTEELWIGGARRHHAKFGMPAMMLPIRFDALIPNLA